MALIKAGYLILVYKSLEQFRSPRLQWYSLVARDQRVRAKIRITCGALNSEANLESRIRCSISIRNGGERSTPLLAALSAASAFAGSDEWREHRGQALQMRESGERNRTTSGQSSSGCGSRERGTTSEGACKLTLSLSSPPETVRVMILF